MKAEVKVEVKLSLVKFWRGTKSAFKSLTLILVYLRGAW